MDVPSDSNPSESNKRISLTFDYRIIVFILLAIIAGMLFLWKPWGPGSADSNARTIDVTGTATVRAEPDEYVFSPNYQFRNADKDKALAELTKKSADIVAKLKELGVKDTSIKTNSSGNGDYYPYYFDPISKLATYSLQLTVTINDRDMSQKIQDYLVTTTPQGSVSPQANFSDAKRKELEAKARDDATKEARTKADQSAKNLGFKIGKVKAVSDGVGFGDVYSTRGAIALDSATETSAPAPPKLGIQPGENELNYSVTVTYYLR